MLAGLLDFGRIEGVINRRKPVSPARGFMRGTQMFLTCSFSRSNLWAMHGSKKMPALKGRGALSNHAGRYEPFERVSDGDPEWWDTEDTRSSVPTQLFIDNSRTILTENQSPDVPFCRSINPYRGCEHGCIYCFARPSHAWLGLSPGLDFETKLAYKPLAAEQLEQAFKVRGFLPKPLALGANTDPYQPVERNLGLSRRCLEVLREFHHPVAVITKSTLILRDLDLLTTMAAERLVMVCVSVTTLNTETARRLEPRAPIPARRVETIRRLAEAGVPTAVLISPIIPAVTDHELEGILEAAAGAGAASANYILIRLPLEVKSLFGEWLKEHMPERAARVLSLIRQHRDGALYQSQFSTRMLGWGPLAHLLNQRFERACRQFRLQSRNWALMDYSRFRVPNTEPRQLSLFPD